MLYTDSRLARKSAVAYSVWSTRIMVFLICIAVGVAGSVFVRQLGTDPRKEVRGSSHPSLPTRPIRSVPNQEVKLPAFPVESESIDIELSLNSNHAGR